MTVEAAVPVPVLRTKMKQLGATVPKRTSVAWVKCEFWKKDVTEVYSSARVKRVCLRHALDPRSALNSRAFFDCDQGGNDDVQWKGWWRWDFLCWLEVRPCSKLSVLQMFSEWKNARNKECVRKHQLEVGQARKHVRFVLPIVQFTDQPGPVLSPRAGRLEKDNRIMVAEQCWLLIRRFLGDYTLVRVGIGLDVFWYCGYWNSGYEHRDGLTRPWNKLWRISSNSWALNSKQYSNCRRCWKISKQASAERENALQAQLSDMLERWNRDAADVEVRLGVDPEHGTPRRHRAFIESRAFSKLVNFDSKVASWKDWASKFENMAAVVVPSSRDTLDWAAQQDTPILNVDDGEAGPDSVEINLQVYVALAELLEGEALDIVQNTTRGAGLEAWRKLVRRFDPQTVGRKRTLLSRESAWVVTSHWTVGRTCQIVSVESARKNSDDVRSGILTEMCPEHIKTHIHFNLFRLPDYASVRSEIETFLEARQSSSNLDAMDIGSLHGQKGVCRKCGQKGHWAASCPKRVKSGGKGDEGKGQGKKGKSSKGKDDDGKGKGNGGKWQARKAFDGYCNHCWKWGHMEKNCLIKSKSKFGKSKSASSLDESEKMDQRTLHLADSVCAHFETIVMTGSGQNCRKVTFTLDSGAAVSAAPHHLGDDYPIQIEEPRSYKTATGSLVQDEGFRVLPIVIEEGLHRSMNFRVVFVHKALVSASKVCRKGYQIILDSKLGRSGMLHKRTNEWIGLREEKGVYVFDGWVSPAVTVGRKRSKSFSLTPYEHNVDVALVDFPRQENHP